MALFVKDVEGGEGHKRIVRWDVVLCNIQMPGMVHENAQGFIMSDMLNVGYSELETSCGWSPVLSFPG